MNRRRSVTGLVGIRTPAARSTSSRLASVWVCWMSTAWLIGSSALLGEQEGFGNLTARRRGCQESSVLRHRESGARAKLHHFAQRRRSTE
jgi:hypothetical protein